MDGQNRFRAHGEGDAGSSVSSAGAEHAVMIPLDELSLEGTLTLPDGARAIVVFAHGSGSSRHSPRNRFVAEEINAAGLGTLLMDLLTEREGDVDASTGELRFGIGLLAARLVAAARLPDRVGAIVSRGGRPDLAEVDLPNVKAPTLLIVGGRDDAVIDLNQKAMARMTSGAPVKLEIVPGATHLFEEKGALTHVAHLARDWFLRYLIAEARAD